MTRLLLVLSVFATVVLLQCSIVATATILSPAAPELELSDGRYNESPLPAASASLSTRRQLARILSRLVEESQSADRAQRNQNHRGPQFQSTLEDPDQAVAVEPDEDELIADIAADNGEIRQLSRKLVATSRSEDIPLQVAVDAVPSASLPSVSIDQRGTQTMAAAAAGLGRRQRGTGATKRGPGVCINSCLTGGMTFVRCKSMCHW